MTNCNPWANDEALYKEMLGFMPNLYFLGNHSEAAYSEHCLKEFSRIRRLICTDRHFNEECYACNNGGKSPFDAVRAAVKSEIRRRIRPDENLRTLLELREGLISRITDAVVNHKGFIDTLYIKDNNDEEYEDSPIVVTEDESVFQRYGGYEAATLYNLKFRDGTVICMLNGESGENFEEPITAVQTEGLVAIAQWLEEYGFITEDTSCINVCEKCGSTDIQTQAWVDVNSHRYIGETGIDRDDNWCDECEENIYFCTKAEFMERMESWWENADFSTMESVTGYRQEDFPAEDGSQNFVDACNAWWKAKSYDDKRTIWKMYNTDEE